jgi:SNF2 family DNA or RNA helicase
MNVDGTTYLIYDKFHKDHNFNNKDTLNIKIDDIFTSNDYIEMSDEKAIEEFNKFGGIYKIPHDLDKNIYKVFMFINKNLVTKITIVSVNNDKLKSYSDFKQIPNLDFLTNICRYHAMYEKSRKLNGQIDSTFGQPPKIMESIISHVSNKVGETSDPIIENPNFLTCNLYNYQKRSVNWMLEREKMMSEINYNLNDEIVFGDYHYDIVRQIFCKNNDRKLLQFNGGALIDEVGLGKTIQMTTLSIMNPSKNDSYYQYPSRLYSRATLVICPNQLCGQWKREIEKMVSLNLNIIYILTKVHFDKYTYQDILDADFVIVSSAFLENKCYVEKITKGISTNKNYLKSTEFNFKSLEENVRKLSEETFNNPLSLFDKNVNILGIHWHRIIIDEFHEIFTVDKFKHVGNILPIFKATYKWAVTGTPFNKDSICLLKMLEFATGFKNTYDNKIFNVEQIITYMKNNFFRRNTKKSITDEYNLPPIKESVLWLKFSSTERMMYNAYLANPNNDKFSVFLRQICCHPKLADEIKDSLSNCKTLEDIQKTMVGHYQTNMKQAEKKLNITKIRKEVYSKVIQRYEVRRMKRLLKQLEYKVIVEFLPEIDKSLIETLKNDEDQEFNFEFDDNLEDESSDDEEKPKKYKGTVRIKEDNHQDIIHTIGNLWNTNKITLETMYANLERLNTRIGLLQKEYEGKKTTYDFYNNVMERIKKTAEKNTKDSEEDSDDDSDSDSDSDDDDEERCGICLGDIPEDDIGVTKCGHIFCYECIKTIIPQKHQCPYCKKGLKDNEIFMISYERKKKETEVKQELKDKNELINKVGTKLANLIFFLKNSDKHTIIFSQWDDLLKKVGDVLDDYGISNVFCKGNTWQRDKAIRTFNADQNIKVIMLSSDSAASGSNLTKASQVILLDPVYGPYEFRRNTEWQAIGRAHRMGQTKQVEVIRMIIKDTIEDEIYMKNLEEDKKFKESIKVFESTDDTINLSKEKLEELMKSNQDKEKEKVNKPAKKVVVKKKSVLKNVESDSENEDDDI